MFKAIGLIRLSLGLLLAGRCAQAQRPMSARGQLIFADEFNTLDRSTWQPMITSWRGGQNQFQYYCNSTNNSWVANGMLNLKPTLTSDRFGSAFLYSGTLDLTKEGCNYGYAETGLNSSCYRKASSRDIINPIQSARLRTKNSFAFTYGIVETRVKLSKGDWMWPSMFMMPVDNVYGTWPRSGEIDLFEIRGNDNLTCDGLQVGNRRAKSTLHWGTDVNKDKYGKTGWNTTVLTSGSYADQFHTFSVEWTKTGIYYYVDNVYIGGVTPPNPGGFWKLGGFQNATNIWANGTNPVMTPFDQQFYLIVKVAVGGNYFPDRCVNGGYQKPWLVSNSTNQMRSFWEARDRWLPTWNRQPNDTTMMVDYIRVYALA